MDGLRASGDDLLVCKEGIQGRYFHAKGLCLLANQAANIAVCLNAKALAAALQARGLKIVSGGTDNHLMLLDLIGLDVTGKELQNRLDSVYITVNKNTVPGEPRSPFVTSGVRIGTPAVTTRGLVESDMDKIAELIYLAIYDYEDKKEYIRSEVLKLTEKYPIYE